MDVRERRRCEGQGEKLRLHASGHARVVYIKREFTVYNKKVRYRTYLSHGPERGLMMQGSFVGGVTSH
jgi:hypothetical protein